MERAFEEILEAIWKADEKGDLSVVAIRKGCPDEIRDEDLHFLEKKKLITREAGRLSLTYEGRTEARNVVRRHRLAESLFATILNLSMEKREEIACEVEHSLPEQVEESICTLLGHPEVCPDGKPIPPGR